MYQALYRKYRPTDFDLVVGQDVIVKILKNSIIKNNFSHAYLFLDLEVQVKLQFQKYLLEVLIA